MRSNFYSPSESIRRQGEVIRAVGVRNPRLGAARRMN
jgi:hypothetical protein